MVIVYILIALLVLIAFYVMQVYNNLVRKKVLVEEGFSGVDVFLKKRHDLIPNLVETVKGYAEHESKTLENVVHARNLAKNAGSVEDKQVAEKNLNQALINLMALAEQYPDLKANTNFQELQTQLSAIEGEIEKSRRYYNGTVRENNILIQSFPSNIIANMWNFKSATFFELDSELERNVPGVKF